MKQEPIRTTIVDKIDRTSRSLLLYVVYWNPADFPDRFVVRLQAAGPTGIQIEARPLIVTEDIHAARAAVPDGLFRLNRDPDDDPVIMETWV